MTFILRHVVLFVCLALTPSLVTAQETPPPQLAALTLSARPASAQNDPPATQPVTAGWRDGFVVESANGDFRLQIGALLQADARFALADDAELVNDTFLIRRFRTSLRGRVARRFEFFFNPDFAGGTLVVQDAYVDTVFSPAFRLRAGRAKSPFGFERLHTVSNMLFFERAMPTSVAPNRDVGVQVLGDTLGGRLSYLAGVMNGVPDGTSGDIDTGDSKDVVGRIVVRPFVLHKEAPLQHLTFGLSGSTGPQSGAAALPAFHTVSMQQPYLSYSGAAADGTRTRYSPQVSYVRKAFGGWAEYVHSSLPIAKGGAVQDIGHDAWQVAAWFVLTGEQPTDATAAVRPRANFDFGNGHYGALQVAARYHALAVDERAVALNLVAPGSSRKAEAWTVGLNWYLTQNFKYVLNFERTVFDDAVDGARQPEIALVFRTQLNF